MDTDLRQQPVANECADNTYYEIADESECGSPYDLSGQPAGTRPTNNMTSAEELSFDVCNTPRQDQSGRLNPIDVPAKH